MTISKVMRCIRCGKDVSVDLVRNITHSGVSNIYWRCPVCQYNAAGPGHWIAHEPVVAFGIDIGTIPIIKDDRSEPCAVCGELGTQYHHFAPRYLFGDEADTWPGAYLCQKHHDQWHKSVTPDMYRHRGDK